MHKILIAVDGSEHAQRAVQYVIGLIREGGLLGGNVEVHLVNVQPLLPTRVIHDLSEEELSQYYQQRSSEAFQAPISLLGNEGITFTSHTLEGHAASQIISCATDLGCDSIVMGSHGNGFLAGVFLGSVTFKVIQLTDIPITLVK